MKIVIAGGSGFLGRPLAAALAADGHEIVILSRRAGAAAGPAPSRAVVWTPDGTAGPWAAELDGAGAVVNLAGESIAGKRWSAAHKQRVLDSRVRATRSLVSAMQASTNPPPMFISGSAVGYYGPRGDEKIPEETPPGSDFLAGVCAQWEAEAQRAASVTRLVCVRTGLVLARDGGALPQMLPPFWFGAGGKVGSGRQYWPWIHRADWIAMIQWAIRTASVTGAINVTAPNPVTNAEFARTLGRAIHRPAFMPAPGFALRLLLGEMADALLLSGQRAVPERPEQLGFTFRYTRVDDALAALFAA
jgi:uncharacterized protein